MSSVNAAVVSAGLFGALVALAELISRYRDDPGRAVASLPAFIYLTVNIAASVAAFLSIRAFGWTFGATGATQLLTQVLVAGFGAAALFRSSLFNVTAGDQVVEVGPSAVLNVILAAADRAVDRQRARIRAERTSASMDGVSFEHGADALFMYCLAAMQNASTQESVAIEDKMRLLKDSNNDHIPDQVKSYIFGLALATVVGDRVLAEATTRLKEKGLICTPDTAIEVNELGLEQVGGAQPGENRAEEDLRLLEILASQGPMSTVLLHQESGVDIGTFGNLIRELSERELIDISGNGEDEVAALA